MDFAPANKVRAIQPLLDDLFAQGKRLGRRRGGAARRLDECAGLSHAEAAARLNVSVATPKRWRRASKVPSDLIAAELPATAPAISAQAADNCIELHPILMIARHPTGHHSIQVPLGGQVEQKRTGANEGVKGEGHRCGPCNLSLSTPSLFPQWS